MASVPSQIHLTHLLMLGLTRCRQRWAHCCPVLVPMYRATSLHLLPSCACKRDVPTQSPLVHGAMSKTCTPEIRWNARPALPGTGPVGRPPRRSRDSTAARAGCSQHRTLQHCARTDHAPPSSVPCDEPNNGIISKHARTDRSPAILPWPRTWRRAGLGPVSPGRSPPIQPPISTVWALRGTHNPNTT